MRVLGVSLVVVIASGCLGELVPLHQSKNQGTGGDGGAPADLADPNPNPNPNPNPTPGAADMATAGPAGDLGVLCINKTTPLTDGHHNPGLNCMTCHNNANPAIGQWTVAGTLYSAITGGTAVAGATVVVTDAAGKVLPIVTSTNGNFYTDQPLAFPVHVRATACPSDLHMATAPAVGACNSCHAGGGAQQIHLP